MSNKLVLDYAFAQACVSECTVISITPWEMWLLLDAMGYEDLLEVPIASLATSLQQQLPVLYEIPITYAAPLASALSNFVRKNSSLLSKKYHEGKKNSEADFLVSGISAEKAVTRLTQLVQGSWKTRARSAVLRACDVKKAKESSSKSNRPSLWSEYTMKSVAIEMGFPDNVAESIGALQGSTTAKQSALKKELESERKEEQIK